MSREKTIGLMKENCFVELLVYVNKLDEDIRDLEQEDKELSERIASFAAFETDPISSGLVSALTNMGILPETGGSA